MDAPEPHRRILLPAHGAVPAAREAGRATGGGVSIFLTAGVHVVGRCMAMGNAPYFFLTMVGSRDGSFRVGWG